jgi:hypothetical protein
MWSDTVRWPFLEVVQCGFFCGVCLQAIYPHEQFIPPVAFVHISCSHILNVNVIQSMHYLILKIQLLLLLVQPLLLDTQAKLGSAPSKSRENCGEVRVPKIFGRACSQVAVEC